MCFVTIKSQNREDARREVEAYKKMAREEFGREVAVWTVGMVVQRETREAAKEYLNYFAVENEDKASVDAWIAQLTQQVRGLDNKNLVSPEQRMRMAASAGGALLIGAAEDVANGIERLSDLGIDGCLLAWNNFDDGLQRFNESVMPLLEQRGLREPFAPTATAGTGLTSSA
jgi:alkanesulfonate monooxygenase SsuD/methylene tetrahydromethanopterin reductase-like flavin-dependent oxidoreductase (luciferase family)